MLGTVVSARRRRRDGDRDLRARAVAGRVVGLRGQRVRCRRRASTCRGEAPRRGGRRVARACRRRRARPSRRRRRRTRSPAPEPCPETVAPFAGDVNATVGGVVSAGAGRVTVTESSVGVAGGVVGRRRDRVRARARRSTRPSSRRTAPSCPSRRPSRRRRSRRSSRRRRRWRRRDRHRAGDRRAVRRSDDRDRGGVASASRRDSRP